MRVPRPVHSGQAPNGRVERERARLELLERQVVVEAGEVLGEHPLPLRVVLGQVDEVEDDQPAGRGRSAVSTESVSRCFDGALDGEPVDDHLDRVLLLLLQRRRLGQGVHDAVDPGPAEALRLQLAEQLDVLTLAAADDRRQHLEPGALLELEHPVDDLLRGLPADRAPADRAVRPAGPRVEQPQVVVDLGDRADGRARVAVGRLLVDRDRRREALDEVDVGLVHLAEELAGVRRQRLDVAALALGEDRVEGQAGLARAGQPGEHDQGSPAGRSSETSLRLCSRAPRTTRRSATGVLTMRAGAVGSGAERPARRARSAYGAQVPAPGC